MAPPPPALLLLGEAGLLHAIATALVDPATVAALHSAARLDPVTAALAARPTTLTLLCADPSADAPARQRRAALRAALLQHGIGHAVISAADATASAAAVQARWASWASWASAQARDAATGIDASAAPESDTQALRRTWRHHCARCGDGDCERRLFRLARSGPGDGIGHPPPDPA